MEVIADTAIANRILDHLQLDSTGPPITATGNVSPAAIVRLFREWRSAQAEQLQAELNAVRSAVERPPTIPALKAIVAHDSGDPAWRTVRPPFVPLTEAAAEPVLAELQRLGFAMPGLR